MLLTCFFLASAIKAQVEEMRTAFEAGRKEEYQSLAERNRDDWKKVSMNIAVIGASGVGKSSFINAIRCLTGDDKGAAKIGAIETTMEICDYPHPDNSMLLFWDLPGVGTDRYPRETYLTDIMVDRYDFFLLMIATRFTENDTWLRNELRKQNKKYFFMRAKIGVDVLNDRVSHPKTHNEQDLIKKIRQDMAEHFSPEEREDVPIFLIDSHQPKKFDFEKLKEQLIEHVSKQKRSALILSLHATSEETIRLKVDELRSRIFWSAALSAAGAAIPIPGLSIVADITIITREAMLYFKQLGLDSDSLKQYARHYSADYKKMRLIIFSAYGAGAVSTITFDGMQSIVMVILHGSSTTLTASAAGSKLAQMFLPVVGSLVSAPLSFGVTYAALKLILSKYEETAIRVMECLRGEEKNMDTAEEATGGADAQSSGDVKEALSQEAETADGKDANNNGRVPIQESLTDEVARVSIEDAHDAGGVLVEESLGDEASKTGTGDAKSNDGDEIEEAPSKEAGRRCCLI